MPDLFEIMRTTRSMRRLKPDPVPDEFIRQVLEAGTCAANAGNTQSWRFLVVQDPEVKRTVVARADIRHEHAPALFSARHPREPSHT